MRNRIFFIIFFLVFFMTFSVNSATIPSFLRTDINISYISDYLVIQDINKDGYSDIISYNRNGCVSILCGKGNGSFKDEIVYNTGVLGLLYINSLLIYDFNRDNFPDIVVGNSILLNDRHSNFIIQHINMPNDVTFNTICGDINNDGIPDLITTSSKNRSLQDPFFPRTQELLRIFLGNGDGTFFNSDSLILNDAYRLYPMYLNNLNNDHTSAFYFGLEDEYSLALYIYHIDDKGAFINYSLLFNIPESYMYLVSFNDSDSDGYIEILLSEGDSPGSLNVYKNDEKGNYFKFWHGDNSINDAVYSRSFPIHLYNYSILDIGIYSTIFNNIDDKNIENYRLHFRFGNANGTLGNIIESDINVPAGDFAYSGDLNNDNKDDIVIPFKYENKIAVLINNITISSVNNYDILSKEFIYYLSCFPNPFNASVAISYHLSKNDFIKIDIFDVCGKKVKSVFRGSQIPGIYSFTWKGDDEFNHNVSSGLFFCVLTNGSGKISKVNKILYLK